MSKKIECSNCYFCSYNKPKKCQFDLEPSVLPKHEFCGRFLDCETGKSIKDLLEEANRNASSSTVPSDDSTLSDEKRKKLKELIRSKIGKQDIE